MKLKRSQQMNTNNTTNKMLDLHGTKVTGQGSHQKTPAADLYRLHILFKC